MAVDHREIAFEDAIEHHLLNIAGYSKADPANFDGKRAVDPMRSFRSSAMPSVVFPWNDCTVGRWASNWARRERDRSGCPDNIGKLFVFKGL